MGTRGLYGFRKNGRDKTTYNHWDSYPDCLGKDMAEFCRRHTTEELSKAFDRIQYIETAIPPTQRQIDECVAAGYYDSTVSTGSTSDWYCLLRGLQGSLDRLSQCITSGEPIYMSDDHTFIEDSLWCEYAYIINLDTSMLEFWVGFQKTPQQGNRYGTTIVSNVKDDGYYPCALALEIPMDDIRRAATADDVVKRMNAVAESLYAPNGI